MKRKHAFITGICGFAGSFLAENLIRHGFTVSGTRLRGESTANIRSVRKEIDLHTLDITNAKKTGDLIKSVKPDYLFHLAAMASVGKSFGAEKITARVNLDGTLNVLDACREAKPRRVIFVSSADCYGTFTPKTKTLTERQPLNPHTPYAISKAAAERMALYYQRQYGLPVVVARSFNHAGPRQDDRFVIASFAKQVAMIELALQKPIMKVGDLRARRDFSDVRDIVDGYHLIATKGKIGEIYQLCSGRAISIKSMLDILLTSTNKSVSVKIDKSRLRKADIPLLKGSLAKASRQLGYKPKFSLEQTLADTIMYWRERLSE